MVLAAMKDFTAWAWYQLKTCTSISLHLRAFVLRDGEAKKSSRFKGATDSNQAPKWWEQLSC